MKPYKTYEMVPYLVTLTLTDL